MAEFEHIPVLWREVLEHLTFPSDRPARLIDGTIGGGGHSALLLKKYPALQLLGIDRDNAALTKAAETLAFAGDRVKLHRGDYSSLASAAAEYGWDKVDGILLDIGVSSPQLDHPDRGFSWRADGPLDMRMDQRSTLTASRLLNFADLDELTRIFREYGEEPKARKLAQVIVEVREKKPFATTADLVEVCDRVIGRKPGKLPAPTLAFQALRIAVNDELGELERALPDAVKLLRKNGRLAVISFHSLEDRIVKEFLREEAAECTCPPGLPVCVCGKVKRMEIVTRKGVTASKEELAENRRAACARLRVAEKLI
ncbi:MAG: 16S rRNA (cytosine(1402)-N(4))-methyltransferase RsmH [Lentisphaeria bacterium]|nr:16S rRNA (cytosine(1402)-N(4))-methyltransferase RsmH [Lentisphaeria bacterium]